jgi:hypothetical protein
MQIYSRESLIRDYERLKQKLGHQPTWRQWCAQGVLASDSTIRHHFGSWNNFLIACGGSAKSDGGFVGSENEFYLKGVKYRAVEVEKTPFKCGECDCSGLNVCPQVPQCSPGKRVDGKCVIFKKLKNNV